MRIDVYCQDGSPLNITPDHIYNQGVGGAELSLMSWAETMAERGHDIRIYNNPHPPNVYNGVRYLPQGDLFPSDHRDVFIAYRSPNPHLKRVKADVKLHWSTDQHTIGNYAADIVPFVDRIVCISPFHCDYYRAKYGGDDKIGYIDLGVRLQDYQAEVEKVPNRFIYCSVPDRGLNIVRLIWPEIQKEIPDASLVITADYRLWGSHVPGDHQHRLNMLSAKNVTYHGKMPRRDMVYEQQRAQIHLFPCIYDELFCVSAAECQVAGAYPVTSDFGALRTTNEFGTIVPGHPIEGGWQREFTQQAVEAAANGPLPMGDGPTARFNWHRICGEWETLIETGEFVGVAKMEVAA